MSNSVYEIITNKIMELLQQGEIPWRKPWKSSGTARNFISKKPYRGINRFLLNCSPYSSPYWLTYKQCTEKDGFIRKGEKSQLVIFWKWLDPKNQANAEDTGTEELSPTTGKIPLLRYFNVFNLEQTEGIPHPPAENTINPFTQIERAEFIIDNMQCRPDITHQGDRAAYSPMFDKVTMPARETFHSSEGYYSTIFHELVHSTGHQGRLGRKGILEPSYFGSHLYSQEELVAEFGASMLCAASFIEQATLENSAAYIQGWLKVLKGDKKLAIIAAGQAQKAADYILGKEDTDPEITD